MAVGDGERGGETGEVDRGGDAVDCAGGERRPAGVDEVADALTMRVGRSSAVEAALAACRSSRDGDRREDMAVGRRRWRWRGRTAAGEGGREGGGEEDFSCQNIDGPIWVNFFQVLPLGNVLTYSY